MSSGAASPPPDRRRGHAVLIVDDERGLAPLRELLESRIATRVYSLAAAGLEPELQREGLTLLVAHGLDRARLLSCLERTGPDVRVIVSELTPGCTSLDDPRVHFVLSPGIAALELEFLLDAALAIEPKPVEVTPHSTRDAERYKAILHAAVSFASANDAAGAARAVSVALLELLAADRVHCLYYDSEGGSLWTLSPVERELRANAGLVGFVARTGRGMCLNRAGDDPRYVAEYDDPLGDGRQQLALTPISGHDGLVHAVVVVVREGHRDEFNEVDLYTLWLFAHWSGPMLEHLARRELTEAYLREFEEQEHGGFRVEALRANRGVDRPGDVVRITGAWVRVTYWMIVSFVFVGVCYLVFGRINRYSAGPAVIRLHERVELTAQVGGALAEVLIEPGQAVERDELLVRFDDSSARDEVERIEQAWQARLRARLLDPSDEVTASELVALRRQRREAQAALARRELRAPVAGVIGDVRIRSGQHIGVGEVVLSVLTDQPSRRVVALMPGADSPQIEPGMTMRIELPGYNRAYQQLLVTHVGEEVIGPTEVRRFVGPALADSLALTGPVLLVEAQLPGPTFVVDDERYSYHEGMPAIAEVRVQSESLLEMLIPALRGMIPHV